MDEQKLYDLIFNTLKKENEELQELTDYGIFFAPELYIATLLGKEIKRKEMDIFGESVEWKREVQLDKKVGPTDIVFEKDQEIFVFEIKLRDTYHSYISDINKLKKLDSNYRKYFLALVDAWESVKEKDKRIKEIKKLTNVSKVVSDFKLFKDRNEGKICCVVGLWRLN